MKQLLVFLAAIVAVHGAWKGGLRVRYDVNPLGFTRSSFISLPRSVSEAKNARWVETARPEGPMPSLVLFCPSSTDRLVCTMYDDTEYIAGLQIAIPTDRFLSNEEVEWEELGFTTWSPPVDAGRPRYYWATQQYYVDEAFLEKSVGERLSARNDDKTLQADHIWVTGFGGRRIAIPNDGKAIAASATSLFTKQGCKLLIGRHYHYNMTVLTPCNAHSILPWYPVIHSDELIGVGFQSFGKMSPENLVRDYFERPSRDDVKDIVPNGPECLYNLAQDEGVVAMHTYFVDSPWLITCLGQ